MTEDQRLAETIAEWLEERTGNAVTFERVEPGDEQVLPEAEERELDAVASREALRGRPSP